MEKTEAEPLPREARPPELDAVCQALPEESGDALAAGIARDDGWVEHELHADGSRTAAASRAR